MEDNSKRLDMEVPQEAQDMDNNKNHTLLQLREDLAMEVLQEALATEVLQEVLVMVEVLEELLSLTVVQVLEVLRVDMVVHQVVDRAMEVLQEDLPNLMVVQLLLEVS